MVESLPAGVHRSLSIYVRALARQETPMPGTQRKGLNIALWVVQVLLAALFLMAGAMKTMTPIDQLAVKMDWVKDLPNLVRFIGTAEFAGALGLLLPSLTRIAPKLTPLAALGLVTVMMLASLFHASRGEFTKIPINVVLGSLAAFVAWGRFRAVPISLRNQLTPAVAR
jgi:putative oxidoreductase